MEVGEQALPNYAGRSDVDDLLIAELETAGIRVVLMPEAMRSRGEVKSRVLGELGQWKFERAWRYWIADGPGIPPDVAEVLHAEYGREVRVDGHAACPSPTEWFHGFAVGRYHIDTPRGLKALAETIKQIWIGGP